MKAYTTIEQSKKLAEILPLESADLWYAYYTGIDIEGYYDEFPMTYKPICNPDKDIPCWSLAALLDVLPRFIEYKGNKYYLRFMKDYVEYANDEFSITGRCLHTTGNDNLVDACVEMIIKLYELISKV